MNGRIVYQYKREYSFDSSRFMFYTTNNIFNFNDWSRKNNKYINPLKVLE